MGKFVWDFSFDDLFLKEGGEKIVAEANRNELHIIAQLREYFEKTAAACHRAIQAAGNEEFLEQLPRFMRYDVTLQLCLIYSLSVLELPVERKSWIPLIEEEAETFFYEYRSFGKRFDFEKYSIMNQIEPVG